MYYVCLILQFGNTVPGPGQYGVPWDPSEKKVPHIPATDESNSGRIKFRMSHAVGSGLAPGLYRHPDPLKELLNKKVSIRGPYDLFTGERSQLPRYVV